MLGINPGKIFNPSILGNFGKPGYSFRTNIVPNPSFEVDLLSGWRSVQGTFSRITTDHQFGIACASFTPNNNNGVWAGWQNNTIAHNTQFTWSAYVKGTLNDTFHFNIYDGNLDNPGSAVTFTGSWQRVNQTITTYNNAYVNPPELQIRSNGGDTTNAILIDGVLVEKTGTLGSYFDGSFTSAFWTGTPNASTSELQI